MRNKYLGVRKMPKNPLAGPLNLLSRQGPHPTKRTLQTLRRLDLEKKLDSDPAQVLADLENDIAQEPTADKMHAIAELAYIAGYEADNLGQDGEALDLYGTSVAYSYYYLFDPAYDRFRNPYDPQFRRACDLYNGALEAALRLVHKQDHLLPGESVELETSNRQLIVSVESRGSWTDSEFKKLEFVSDYQIKGLTNHNHSYGLGVPLIAVRQSVAGENNPAEKYYPKVLCFPVTAFLRVHPQRPGEAPNAPRHCVLELYDPLDATTITVANRLVPLETDISVPLGYTLEKGRKKNSAMAATWGLLDPESAEKVEGLYMVEPYDPQQDPRVDGPRTMVQSLDLDGDVQRPPFIPGNP